MFVPAHQTWVDSGLEVRCGDALLITAQGAARVRSEESGRRHVQTDVGPAGTYHYSDADFDRPFPMPAAGRGPAPCFALIGRIGESGEPFYIGPRMSRRFETSGRLQLGINDHNLDDNAGGFDVAVHRVAAPLPLRIRRRVAPFGPPGSPAEDASVVIFYVDGLRPDVVSEMSAMGHLPNITELFIDGGTQVRHSFTVFPSDTITSNGSMWTGCFSDRHGIKAQIGFNRHTRESENYLGTLGPTQTALMLEREGLDRLILQTRLAGVSLLKGRDAARELRASKTSDIPALNHYVRRSGDGYASGVLPIMGEASPNLWTRYLADEAPLLGTPQADRFIDEANAVYTIEHLLRREDKVTVVWLPETDTVSHHEFRGQFGQARRTIAEADHWIGEIVGHVRRQGRFDSTYFVLVSDHGHIGGREKHLDRFDLANEFFHRPRQVNERNEWIGGGLGMSVRQHRYVNRTMGDSPDQFVFVEAVGDGVARVFLPRGGYRTGDWTGPNSAAQLMQYSVADHLPPVDLIRGVLSIETQDAAPQHRSPIDLALAKLNDQSVLIASRERGWAVIDRRQDVEGRYEYRYRVVGNALPTASGEVDFQEVTQPIVDPLRLTESAPPEAIGVYHSEPRWLAMTHRSYYPDSVVAMTRHMLWDERLRPREMQYAPDLVICSGPSWQFNTFNEPGTAHGHPVSETMRNSLFFSGPNIRRGAILDDPARSVDLLPTVLEMASVPFDLRQLDGRPLRTLFEADRSPSEMAAFPNRADEGRAAESVAPASMHLAMQRADVAPIIPEPEHWSDVDLGGWRDLPFEPRPVYPVQPATVNQPKSQLDANNVVYNVVSLQEVSLNRLFDDTAEMLGLRQRPLHNMYSYSQNWLETRAGEARGQSPDNDWLADAIHAAHWNKVGIGDYSVYSSGNLTRIDDSINWTQKRAANLDRVLARPVGAKSVLATPVTNRVVDAAQYGVWEVRRVGTRWVIRVVDDWIVNAAEDRTDAIINQNLLHPSEIRVSSGEATMPPSNPNWPAAPMPPTGPPTNFRPPVPR